MLSNVRRMLGNRFVCLLNDDDDDDDDDDNDDNKSINTRVSMPWTPTPPRLPRYKVLSGYATVHSVFPKDPLYMANVIIFASYQ